ncbi:MAG: hypothetical protein V3T64_13955, partial [Myxococcota bacterium]
MDRLMIISSDCHIGAEPGGYRDYLERAHLDAYEDALAHPEHVDQRALQVVGTALQGFDPSKDDPDAAPGPLSPAWTAERRIVELEKDGIVFVGEGPAGHDATDDSPRESADCLRAEPR